jgi:hypothetical protein
VTDHPQRWMVLVKTVHGSQIAPDSNTSTIAKSRRTCKCGITFNSQRDLFLHIDSIGEIAWIEKFNGTSKANAHEMRDREIARGHEAIAVPLEPTTKENN